MDRSAEGYEAPLTRLSLLPRLEEQGDGGPEIFDLTTRIAQRSDVSSLIRILIEIEQVIQFLTGTVRGSFVIARSRRRAHIFDSEQRVELGACRTVGLVLDAGMRIPTRAKMRAEVRLLLVHYPLGAIVSALTENFRVVVAAQPAYVQVRSAHGTARESRDGPRHVS